MAAYHEALMRRLGMIDELGTNATALMPRRVEPQINLPAAEQYSGPVGATSGGGKGFNSFMGAISAKESGNNYSARNRDSGAMGKYQIMPANIQGNRGWDYEALGRNISTSQFMASPQLQEAIAKYKLQQYYNKWGPAGAAVAWYAGPGTASKYLANPGRYTRKQGNYPSIASYANAILRAMK